MAVETQIDTIAFDGAARVPCDGESIALDIEA